MIIAGAETTASAIRSILVHVITCPRVYYKLKEEIQRAVSEHRVSTPIEIDEAKQLPYLQVRFPLRLQPIQHLLLLFVSVDLWDPAYQSDKAVIYEGIRIRPPVLGLLPKIVPEGGDEFHGKFLPAGTAICMNMSSLLSSSALFGPDADVFRPERFIELDQATRSEMERNVELAFGYGRSMCLGKVVAFVGLNKVIFEVNN